MKTNLKCKILTCLIFFLISRNGYSQPSQITWNLTSSWVIGQSWLPSPGYYPDGHISMVQSGSDFIGFWSEFNNSRTVANSSYLGTHSNNGVTPSYPVFGGRKNDDGSGSGVTSWANGGAWLMGVHRIPDGRLVGFYHAESHWYPRTDPANGGTAYKTMAVAYSSNEGVSWGTGENYQFLTPPYSKPQIPYWSGDGDACVVRDDANNRWLCYYVAVQFVNGAPKPNESPMICVASSSDANGWVGTWKKWDGSGFNKAGLGGIDTPISSLSGVPGANPSVHWNTYLNRWVMVWHSWGGDIYISTSNNGTVWSMPQLIIDEGSTKLYYPTIIGTTDELGGNSVKLYYGAETNVPYGGCRDFKCRGLDFTGIMGKVLTNVDIMRTNPVRLYPNPAKDMVTLSMPQKADANMEIFDMTGKVAMKATISQTNLYKFSVSTFKSGTYNVIIKIGIKSYQIKLIVE